MRKGKSLEAPLNIEGRGAGRADLATEALTASMKAERKGGGAVEWGEEKRKGSKDLLKIGGLS